MKILIYKLTGNTENIKHTSFIIVSIMLFLLAVSMNASAIGNKSYISGEQKSGSFALSVSGQPASLYISSEDFPGVIRAFKDLQADIERVTNTKPELSIDDVPSSENIVIAGTIGKSPVINKLIKDKKLSAEGIKDKWEVFSLQIVEKPLPGVKQALVIAGSDKRGTIFGIYDLSEQIGVSPWYWWADVPVKQQKDLYVLPGKHGTGEPAVKYRGIFINDEAPALAGWVHEKFGGFNHKFYKNVFELILRLKGNYLWPAMWGRAFYDDDSINPQLADKYGVVIGTSHHEPCMRAHVEWSRYGNGPWNYEKNEEVLRDFWKEGIIRMGTYESLVTVGMRGDGDEAMSEESNIALLEKIVADQRKIIADETGKDPSETRQVWALYKEVQDYYDKGMRVPDDVMLLLCDDNWGNIRVLPNPADGPREGGYGIYYHYDYVGGPRNYKWLNTNPIPRVWEQMHLAYHYGAKELWIVNVGDIKPMEFPISFFLDYAWNPDQWIPERISEYTQLWAEQQFGKEHAVAIADIISKYGKYNGRRKPELLNIYPYSLTDYREAETVVSEYNKLAEKAKKIGEALPSDYQDAYFQLVLHPVKSCANLNELHYTVAKNHMYAEQKRAATNDLADKVKELFDRDAELSRYYNEVVADGKWNHMMDQTHISYTYWQQPNKDVVPDVKTIKLSNNAEMGVSVEGSDKWWPKEKDVAVLPVFDPYHQQNFYIEVFNRGKKPFRFSAKPEEPWVIVEPAEGQVEKEQHLEVEIDWQQAPTGKHSVPITITVPDESEVVVCALVNNPYISKSNPPKGFIESNGYVSIEAEHYTKAVDAPPVKWQIIPNMGKTLSAITTLPVTSPEQKPGGDNPHLEYKVHLFDSSDIKVRAYMSPTLNFQSTKGLRYAVSFDNEQPQVVNIHEADTIPDWKYPRSWTEGVANNIKITVSDHKVEKPGEHTLKFWMVDPGIVLQKIVIETGDVKYSYLGPPESCYLD
jgi:hypothetical protein